MPKYLGLMSGTSADGVDAVVVEIGAAREFRLLATHHLGYADAIRMRALGLIASGHDELHRAAELDVTLGRLFADAAYAVLASAGLAAHELRAIGSHGQTIRHSPCGDTPYTMQIANPAVIAEQTGIATVADFRRRDMAAGGQGAPLVPAFHHWLFGAPERARAVVNIGGIANVTLLPSASSNADVTGFDTGPGNALMDIWTETHLHERFDREGHWAASGTVQDALLARMLAEPYFVRKAPKSTGRELFGAEWLEQMLQGTWAQLAPADVQATLAELTAVSIAEAITSAAPATAEVFICGGGARNDHLMRRLQARLAPREVTTTAALGLDPQWVEASAFAWLAHQCLEGAPGNLPSVTGARRAVILGAIYSA